MLYKEDWTLCLAWDKVGRLRCFGSPSAVEEPNKLSQAAELEFWFRFDETMFRISASKTTDLSCSSSITADKYGNINLPIRSTKLPVFHPEKLALPKKKKLNEKGHFSPIHPPQSFMTVHKNTQLVTDTWFCLVDFRFRLWWTAERSAEKCRAVLTPRYINSMVLVNIATYI